MVLIDYKILFFKGIGLTLASWLSASALSLIMGGTLGILSATTKNSLVQYICFLYTFIAKSVPAYVHILIAYFVIPAFLGVSLPALLAGIGALAFCSSGYVAEIVRGAILSVDKGQWDAAFVLGYSTPQTLLRIIVLQALKIALPALLGEIEQLLKSTSLLATIGISELTRSGMNIISRELNPIEVYCTIALIYMVFSAVFHSVIRIVTTRVRL